MNKKKADEGLLKLYTGVAQNRGEEPSARDMLAALGAMCGVRDGVSRGAHVEASEQRGPDTPRRG